jgi:oligopeptide transport system ATP-binding protein
MNKILELKDLEISFAAGAGQVQAVRGISYQLDAGGILGIVGESGCGKSIAALSVLRLLPPYARITGGAILFKNRSLTQLSEKEMEKIRGKELGMVFQDPAQALNPVLSIETQLTEPLLHHYKLSRKAAKEIAVETLARVGIPEPEKGIRQFPHEFSGGMRQRVMIAMAVVCRPSLIIADEPTSFLDAVAQAGILRVLKMVNQEAGTSIILISHDLGAIRELCGRIAVMYSGLILEQGSMREILAESSHPYTRELLKALPSPTLARKKRLSVIGGQPPDLLRPPRGCPFWPRCPYAMIICREQHPPASRLSTSHTASCWLLRAGSASAAGGVVLERD